MKTEWILVMNATRARIIRGLPKHGEPAPSELVVRSESHKLRDIMSDKPGRSFSSGSKGRRSAISYGTDPLREDEMQFVREVVALLDMHRLAGDFDSLVVFSDPHMLGVLRGRLPPALKALIRREVPKNLAGIIETALPEVLKLELGVDSGFSGSAGAAG